MIGLDTNILVCFLTQDDPIRSPRVTEIIERRLTEEKPGFVSIVADGRDRVGARPGLSASRQ
jgi:predicted nucleic-acid-binding protein